MKRTLTKTGTSLVTTIPASWAKEYGLKKGDEVSLAIDGNRLILTTEKTNPEAEKVVIDQSQCAPYEERVLGKFYIAGYNLVELTITDPSRIDEIKNRIATHELGLEPLEETSKRIVFTSVVTENEEQYNTFERKAFLAGLESAELALQGLEKNDPAKYDEAQKLELTNTKFCAYCERYLNMKGAKNHAFTYVIIWTLEKIVDEYKYLCQYAKPNKVKASKQTLDYFREVNQYFRQLYEIYYKFDMDVYLELALRKGKLIEKGYSLLKTAQQNESPLITHLMTITRLISECLTSNIGRHAKEIAKRL